MEIRIVFFGTLQFGQISNSYVNELDSMVVVSLLVFSAYFNRAEHLGSRV